MQVWIAAGIFLGTYALIITERVHRTIAALLGGVAMLLLGVLHQDEALSAIDWNVIFLLAGMMVIANLLRETGLFQWIGIQAVKLGRGDPFRILVILSLITAISSALLDNVTIVILVVPVTLFVAASLEISPIPFLVAEILASNIGGTATLIGDPPNILIGSAADIDFVTFAANMVPITLLILAVFLVYCWLRFRRDLRVKRRRPLDIEALETEALITDRRLLRRALIIVGGVLVGFLTHAALHFEPATIALAGATILLLWTRRDPHAIFREVQWTTLLFFVGLFITVEAVVQVGLIEAVAGGFLRLTHGSIHQAATALLWLSAVASGIVDNIPYTAAMIPVVETLGQTLPIEPLWWSLALGACLGGNATLVGASANVVVADLAARSGHPISFRSFLGYGLVTTAFSMLLATAYVWLRYL
jgi:Na+/H+ antiporter NhaD/arsenite permease-like protein